MMGTMEAAIGVKGQGRGGENFPGTVIEDKRHYLKACIVATPR